MKYVRHEPAGIGAPGFGHDADSDWSIDSTWHDTETGVTWKCLDNRVGAATWYVIAVAPPKPSGTYDGPEWITGIADSSGLQPNRDHFLPMQVRERTPALSMFLSLVQPGSTGAAAWLSIYGTRYGMPVQRWKDFGEIALDSGTAGIREIVNETVLPPGVWWLSANFKSVVTMPVMKRISAALMFGTPFFTSTSITSGNANRGLFIDRQYGPPPAQLNVRPAGTNDGNVPLIGIRRT